jgi:hypothetical protein
VCAALTPPPQMLASVMELVARTDHARLTAAAAAARVVYPSPARPSPSAALQEPDESDADAPASAGGGSGVPLSYMDRLFLMSPAQPVRAVPLLLLGRLGESSHDVARVSRVSTAHRHPQRVAERLGRGGREGGPHRRRCRRVRRGGSA